MQLSLLEASRYEDPSANDRIHVARVSECLLRELDAVPPINLGMVASYQGVGRIVTCDLPHAGCLLTDPQSGQLEIRLRRTDNPRRRRFSGFHEISHTFMPGYQLQLQWRCEPAHVDPRKVDLEALCDVGAAELLLPRVAVMSKLDAAEFGMQTAIDLADLCDASLQASAHRLVDLWREDAMLIVAEVQTKPHEQGQEDPEPKLRISYARKQGAWPYIRRFKSCAETDPLTRALNGELVDTICDLRGFSSHAVSDVHVSARLCPYTDAKGVQHARVIALYRRPNRGRR